MKRRHSIQLLTGLLCGLIICAITLEAQNAPVDTNKQILSGSTQKAEAIAIKADVIFIGQVADLGIPMPAAANTVSYPSVQVKILQVLRGSINGEMVKVAVRTMSGGGMHEMPPIMGNTYIFFIHKNAESGWIAYDALKLLPATDDNITKVKALIAAAPVGK